MTGQTPLFGSLLNYRYQGGSQQLTEERRTQKTGMASDIESSVIFTEENTNYPLSLAVNDILEGGFSLDIQVAHDIGGERVSGMLLTVLSQLMDSLEHDADSPVHQLNVLSAQEREYVLYGVNQTATPFADEICIHQHFEQQVLRQPEATAVCCEDASLTYAELNRQSNQLAHWLVAQGCARIAASQCHSSAAVTWWLRWSRFSNPAGPMCRWTPVIRRSVLNICWRTASRSSF
ncbi:hypothetical protein P4S72_12005 [Vibrio sp. PP-XX7]